MKAQSFEYQLRHATPPTPDPEARLRAKRAAVAEFERIHVQSENRVSSEKPTTTSRVGSGGLLGWLTTRNTWVGGLATACVVVVGVSLFYLMPAEKRVIHPPAPPPLTPVTPVVRPLPEPAPSNEVTTGTPPTAAAQPPRDARIRLEKDRQPKQKTSSTRMDSRRAVEERKPESLPPEYETDRPAPAVVNPAPALVDEVVVQAAPAPPPVMMNSPVAVTAVEPAKTGKYEQPKASG